MDAAVRAQTKSWPAYERATALRRASVRLAERSEELALSICREAGKPITAARGEVSRAVETFQFSAEAARSLAGVTVPMSAVASGDGLTAFEQLEPRGVVAAITPFNFPLNLVAHKIGRPCRRMRRRTEALREDIAGRRHLGKILTNREYRRECSTL